MYSAKGDGPGGENRTRVSLLPRQVGHHYPTPG